MMQEYLPEVTPQECEEERRRNLPPFEMVPQAEVKSIRRMNRVWLSVNMCHHCMDLAVEWPPLTPVQGGFWTQVVEENTPGLRRHGFLIEPPDQIHKCKSNDGATWYARYAFCAHTTSVANLLHFMGYSRGNAHDDEEELGRVRSCSECRHPEQEPSDTEPGTFDALVCPERKARGYYGDLEGMVPGWYYLEFHDPDKPHTRGPDGNTQSFLGGAYVYAATGPDAIQRSWVMGIDHGGDVAFEGVFSEQEMDDHVKVADRNRLLGHHEIHTWRHQHYHP